MAEVVPRSDRPLDPTTERYVHAAQVAFPGAAEKAEERIFGFAGAL